MATYEKPDVRVTVNLAEPSPVVPRPDLRPVIVGAHYYVVKEAFASHVDADEVATISYPDLPDSWNDDTKKLEVDVTSDDYAPKATLVLDSTGEEVDVTDKLTFGTEDITKAAWETTYNGQPLTGSLFISYRALSDKYTGVRLQELQAQSLDDLRELFGPNGVGPANPLGFGMYCAYRHAGIEVAGIAIGVLPDQDGAGRYTGAIDDELLSFQYSLDYLKQRDVYMILPMTQNDYVADICLAHVTERSNPNLGNEPRRTMFATTLNELWPVRGEKDPDIWFSITAANVAGQDALNGGPIGDGESAIGSEVTIGSYTVRRIAAGDGSSHGTYIIRGYEFTGAPNTETTTIDTNDYEVAFEWDDGDGVALFAYVGFSYSLFSPNNNRVNTGDKLHVYSTSTDTDDLGSIDSLAVANDLELARVTWENTVTLEPNTLLSNRVRVYRVKKDRDVVEGIRDMARSYNDERLLLAGPGYVATQVDNDEVDVPSFYALAALGAEFCLVGRQAAGAEPGANNITGFRDSQFEIWKSNGYFTREELDIAASGGFTWFINLQKGLPIFTRDSISTRMTSIEEKTFVLGVERDYLVRILQAGLRPYLRQYRIDRSLQETITTLIGAISRVLTRVDSRSRTFQSIELEEISQNADNPEQLDITIRAVHLYVFKYAEVTINIVAPLGAAA